MRLWLCRLVVVGALTVAANLIFNAGSSAHFLQNYAVLIEKSWGTCYRGVEGYLDTANPSVGSNSFDFTNATFWAGNSNYCGGSSWIETGWSKRVNWNGEVRYKLGWLLPPECTFKINSLGRPAIGSIHKYRMVFCDLCQPTGWFIYIDGEWKAGIATTWASANSLQVGGEATLQSAMGPSYFYQLMYKTGTGSWYQFNYGDEYHCDPGYRLVHPGNAPDALYDWGPTSPWGC
jgi:hypothetical protein